MYPWQNKKEKRTFPYLFFLFLIAILSFFILMTLYFFPKKGVEISDNLTLTLPEIETFSDADFSDAEIFDLSLLDTLSYTPSYPVLSSIGRSDIKDQVYALPPTAIEHNSLSEKENLQHFFTALQKNKLTRILYFGDSQIEGDRITHGLRNKLREYFQDKGHGIGMFPLNPNIPVHPNIKISLSSGWKISPPVFNLPDREAHIACGTYLATTSVSLKQDESHYFKITTRDLKKYRPFSYQTFYLQCRNTVGTTRITLQSDDIPITKINLQPSDKIRYIKFKVPLSIKNSYQFDVSGQGVFEVLGIGIEDDSKIMVDNIPLRSNDGLDFTKVDAQSFIQAVEQLQPALIIYQFGLNFLVREDMLSFYAEQLNRQLAFLKKSFPAADILVVGVNDYAARKHGMLRTSDNIDAFRYIQRQQALNNGCAYWDLYLAMGAKKSAIYWSTAYPPLMTKDYCHFTADGIEIVEDLLFNALIQDYIDWTNVKNKQ